MMKQWVKQGRFFALLLPFVISGCFNHQKQTYQGYIEGNFTYIASEVSGKLTEFDVKRGTQVTQNQPLFSLELKPQSDALLEAQAKLDQANSNLANLKKGKRPSELAAIKAQAHQVIAKLQLAKITMERYQKLYQEHYIQKESLDEATSNFNDLQAKLNEVNENLTTAKLTARNDEIKAAEAQVSEAEAALKQAQWQVNEKAIRAPIAGIVFDRYYFAGEVVPANHPVVSILTPDNLYLVTYVPEDVLSKIKLAQSIQFNCDECQRPLSASVSFISPTAEYTPPIIYSQETRDKLIYRVEADLTKEEAQNLHPGQPVTVMFQ